MIDRLDKLVTAADGNQPMLGDLLNNVKSLKSGVEVSFLSPDAVNQLRGILDLSDRVLLKNRQNAIMQGLKTPDWDSRFVEVSDAHGKTLSWILRAPGDEPEESDKGSGDEEGAQKDSDHHSEQTDNQRVPRERAGALFVDWLKNGSGIFHVSGKSGAGKSTLMKFLCKNPRTDEYLKTWAGPRKSLVLSKFFWKEGSKQQRSLSGLLRGLLYHLLESASDLIPTAFLVQWDATQSFQHMLVLISDSDIEVAFKYLMAEKKIYRHHKFVFFIDGLDEFEGDYHQ